MTVEPNRARLGKAANSNPASADNIMRSQSLYRKWRSQTFGELVGQEAITRTLQNAIAGGRVGHAYLFCGPRGTGKTSSARLLAKALNCTYPDLKARPCNECEACRSIAEGRAMDLIEIDAASNRGIDEIRSLRDTIGYQPSQFKYKFYIIDEVHMLTEPAFNALLKTLEEPPPHAIFVLATTDPQDIPATVVSRCQRFDFQRISLEQITARLAFVCEQEGIEADTGALELVARQATGSLRDALSLLDQLIVFSGSYITADAVRAMLGVMNSEAVAEFVNCLIDQDMAGGLELINRLVQSGTDMKRFNREIVDHLRLLMLVKANPGANELVDMTREALQVLRDQSTRLDLGEIVGFLKIFSTVDYNLKVSPYGQLPLEIALMEAVLNRPAPAGQIPAPQTRPVASTTPARPAPVETPAPAPARIAATIRPVEVTPEPEKVEVKTRPESKAPAPEKPAETKPRPVEEPPVPAAARPVRSGLISAKTTEVTTITTETAEIATLELSQAVSAWQRVMDTIGAQSQMTKALLKDARPVAINGSQLVLAFKWEFHHKQISQDKNRRMVEDTYTQVLGQKVLISCVLDKEEEEGGNASNEGKGPDKPGGSTHDDKRRKAAQMFNARIVE
jgi:DNA polymerase-3 subunit gamma/tau